MAFQTKKSLSSFLKPSVMIQPSIFTLTILGAENPVKPISWTFYGLLNHEKSWSLFSKQPSIYLKYLRSLDKYLGWKGKETPVNRLSWTSYGLPNHRKFWASFLKPNAMIQPSIFYLKCPRILDKFGVVRGRKLP